MKALLSIPSSLVGYFQNVYRELRLVQWITPGNVLRATIAVIVITIAVTFLIMGIDAVLVAIRSLLLNRTLA